VVTRRPLELRLSHVADPTAKPYGVFEKEDQEKMYDFGAIKKKIEYLTDKVCGNNAGIVDDPIVLKVYSPSCPDLTLIDLPGITRIAQGDQVKDIEKITKNMAARYCKDERTIILCVVPANADMSTSDGLQMAMELDPKGERTLGVITKIDIMDKGTNARKMMMNEVIKLKLGYVGVKGRNQQDISAGVKVGSALQEEKNYFATHPAYSNMPPGYTGTDALTNKLTSTMYKHIKKVMPSIILEIDNKIYECDKGVKELGTPLPGDDRDKLLLIWKLISDFTDKLKTSISGEYNSDLASSSKKDLLGGVRIRLKFNDLFMTQMGLKYKASKRYSDSDIKNSLRMHTGNSLPGFTSAESFESLMTPLLLDLKEPALELLEEVHSVMEQITIHYINETFVRFPMFLSEVTEAALGVLQADKDRTKLLLNQIIDANIGYTYTKDPDYISIIIPTAEKIKLEKQKEKEKKAAEEKAAKEKEEERLKTEGGQKGDKAGKPEEGVKKKPTAKDDEEGKEEDDEEDDKNQIRVTKEKAQKNVDKLLVEEMRKRIDAYFRVVATQLADMIPKLVGFNLVSSSMMNMQFSVYKRVSSGQLFELLKEPEHIVKKRETLKKILEVLRNSRKILMRDPDLAYSLNMGDNKELIMAKEKEADRKKTAAEEKKKTFFQRAGETMSDLGSKIKSGASDLKDKISGPKEEDKKKQDPILEKKPEPKPVVTQPAPVTNPSPAPKPASKGLWGDEKPTQGAPTPTPVRQLSKQEQDLAMEGAKIAYQNKDAVIKVAKDNPELIDKGFKVIGNAMANPAPTPADPAKKGKINSLFGI
jgi:hypothetical protein